MFYNDSIYKVYMFIKCLCRCHRSKCFCVLSYGRSRGAHRNPTWPTCWLHTLPEHDFSDETRVALLTCWSINHRTRRAAFKTQAVDKKDCAVRCIDNREQIVTYPRLKLRTDHRARSTCRWAEIHEEWNKIFVYVYIVARCPGQFQSVTPQSLTVGALFHIMSSVSYSHWTGPFRVSWDKTTNHITRSISTFACSSGFPLDLALVDLLQFKKGEA